MLLQAGDELEQGVGEALDLVGEDLVVLLQVDLKDDHRALAVVVGAAQRAPVDELDHPVSLAVAGHRN